MQKRDKRFKKGQIVYCQGEWRCRVVSDLGDGSLAYIALEGTEPTYKGEVLNAEKSLFKEKRREKKKKVSNP